MKKKEFTFIDLFAGLGGFHLAMESLGGECVFASELKEDLRNLYKINFPQTKNIVGDITKDENINKVPPHDVLCAGFPCQPFSQAGKRQGFNDKKARGTMFDYICKIIEVHKPKYVFLENVANLKGHNKGKTWQVIQERMDSLEYDIHEAILSPHQFDIPQHRKRIYIVGKLRTSSKDVFDFIFPSANKINKKTIHDVIDENDKNYMPIKEESRKQLMLWQEFLDKTIEHGETIPRFPIWAMEFGATYLFEERAPSHQTFEELVGRKGNLGERIKGETKKDCIAMLPVYAQKSKKKKFPKWKITYIRKNREFYNRNKEWLDQWLKKIKDQANSFLKLEWNCGDSEPILNNKIIQFRASGIRVKKATYSPALNLVGTQIPIFPWVPLPDSKQHGRYMTTKEAATLQGMEELDFSKLTTNRIYEALGNAVNVKLVNKIAERLLKL